MIKKRKELISQYLNFFKLKKHAIIGGASIIPENDPTVLFTTAGMHPLVPFLLGQSHPSGKRLTNVQKCLRTGDIDEVGDSFHHTFFEMLGNWSLGDYFKEDAIKMSFEFLTNVLQIPKEKLAFSVFEGDENIETDNESAEFWKKHGINEDKIVFMSKEYNWWGPAGETGPCGPDTEMFYYVGAGKPSKESNPKTKPNEWCEIWNDVFMQYNKTKSGKYEELIQKNVDTGMGVERTLTILQGLKDNYMTEIFLPVIERICVLSKKRYGFNQEDTRAMRIIADHLRAAVFILGDNSHIPPSNLGQGYVLRRLIRRTIRYGMKIGIKTEFCSLLAPIFIDYYKEDYPELEKNKNFILNELDREESRFKEVIEKGLKEFEKIKKKSEKIISGHDAFILFSSYGFPIELTKELAKESGLDVEEYGFNQEFKEHQKLSRTATAGTFKSGLIDNTEQTTRLHTTTHLLHQALRHVLGEKVKQKGSNITSERLRFDFSFDRKLTSDELKEIEKIVNDQIKEGFDVKREEMTIEQAKKQGALAFFDAKYGEKVSVYSIGNFSKEVCTGPHVTNIGKLGHFKIIKEEAVAAGIRRIKAILE